MIMSLFVIHNNERILSAEEDCLVKVWLAEDGVTLMSVTAPVNILHVAPNDQYAISGDGDHVYVA